MKSNLFKMYLVWGVGVCLFFTTSAINKWIFPWPKSSGGSSSYRSSGGRSTWGTWGGGK